MKSQRLRLPPVASRICVSQANATSAPPLYSSGPLCARRFEAGRQLAIFRDVLGEHLETCVTNFDDVIAMSAA